MNTMIGWCDLRILAGISVMAFFFLAGVAWAQPHEEWNRTFRGEQDNEVFSVQQTGDGNYIVAGTTSFGAGKSYAWLRKVGEEQNGTATPTASPTETSIPPKTLRAVSNETLTVTPLEKVAGFEFALAIKTLLAVYEIKRKRR